MLIVEREKLVESEKKNGGGFWDFDLKRGAETGGFI